jgi:two-component system, LytTR family, sensor kinase
MLWAVTPHATPHIFCPAAAPDLRRSPFLYGIAALWLLSWTLVATTEFARWLHAPGIPHWHPFIVILISPAIVGSWLAWAIATRRFERPSIDPARTWFRYQLRALPWLILAAIPLVWGLRYAFYHLIGFDYGEPPPVLLVPFEAIKISLFYILLLTLVFGLRTLARRREDHERILAIQKALAEAQLAQLQAQLRPHFLFNALNTISSLMQTDVPRADRMLSQLGDLLRASLGTPRRDSIPLHEELRILRKYTDIMQERFGERAVVTWNVAEDALDVPLPSMLLQPLLENAYKHGVERNSAPVFIDIAAERNGTSLQVKIHNTSSTLGSESPTSHGVGISNCRERLRLLYGASAQLRVEEDGAGGVQAIVMLPCPAPAA